MVIPDRPHPDPSLALASALEREGKADAAVDVLRRLVARQPAAFDARMCLGSLLAIQRKLSEAASVFAECAALDPASCDAHLNLAATRLSLGDLPGARAAVEAALALDPERWSAHHNLGAILDATGDVDAAARAYGRAAELAPLDPRPSSALGSMLLRTGRLAECLAACGEAIRRQDTSYEAHHNQAVCLQRLGRERAAAAAFRRAIARRPDSWLSHNNLGLVLLKQGRFAEGFREFEWRFRRGGEPAPRSGRPQPVWRGEPLDGRCILLCAEQGLGDQIQFVRFASRLRRHGAGAVFVEAAPNLAPLVATCPGVDGVVDPGAPCPDADLQLPLLSVATPIGLDLATLDPGVPYLFPDRRVPPEAERLLAGCGDRLKVGIVWTGDPKNPLNAQRSCSPADFAPLGRIPGVQLVSVQYEDDGVDAAWLHAQGILPLGRVLGDLGRTAAILKRLDLLISVDTMTVHLAGALGHPVWTLLPYPCDWRWLTRRDDSPWYPSMRLFRRQPSEEWPAVLRRVERRLRDLVARRRVSVSARRSLAAASCRRTSVRRRTGSAAGCRRCRAALPRSRC